MKSEKQKVITSTWDRHLCLHKIYKSNETVVIFVNFNASVMSVFMVHWFAC